LRSITFWIAWLMTWPTRDDFLPLAIENCVSLASMTRVMLGAASDAAISSIARRPE
jgi:hypothetical protein